jgi:hypothetical protein
LHRNGRQVSQQHAGSGNRGIGDAVHDTNAPHIDLAVVAIGDKFRGQFNDEPVPAFVILAGLADGRFTVQIGYSDSDKSFCRGVVGEMVGEDVERNRFRLSLLTGPAGEERLFAVMTDAIDPA